MATTAQRLPRWDMTSIYPSLESPEFEHGFDATVAAIAALADHFDGHGIDLPDAPLPAAAAARVFDELLPRYNATLDQAWTLAVYIACFVNTDSRDSVAQAHQSTLQKRLTTLSQLGTRLTAWIGGQDVAAPRARSALAREHAYALTFMQTEATRLMSPPEEALASPTVFRPGVIDHAPTPKRPRHNTMRHARPGPGASPV